MEQLNSTLNQTATVRGKEITVARLDALAGMRCGAIARELVRMAEVPPETITATLGFSDMFKLSMLVMDTAVKDFVITDLEDPNEKGTPGRFAKLVFIELCRLTGLPYDEILTYNQDELYAIVGAIWAQEGSGPFVQTVLGGIRPVTGVLSATFELVKSQARVATMMIENRIRSLGGPTIGGEPPSLSPSPLLPTDGPNETYSPSPWAPLSPTNEPAVSGAS